MRILAIDTSLSAAAACVFDSETSTILAQETLAMARGHDQTIMPLIDRVVAQTEGGVQALGRVAVAVGPGSFTGIRVGIAVARAIGLACSIDVVGVSSLAAFAAPLVLAFPDGVAASAVDARHDRIYVLAFAGGRPLFSPRLVTAREAVRAMGSGPLRLAGSGAMALAIEAWGHGISAEIVSDAGAPDIEYIARLGLAADPASAPARPLYLKAPDVKAPAPKTQAVPG